MIAFRNYVVATGDLKFAKKLKGNLLKAADFMASLDRDGDGILEVPFHGNSMHVKGDERVCRNWWDDFAFGWKDAYTNLLTYRAWGFAAEVCEKLGDEKSAEKLEGYRKAFAKSFHKIFYNPETGVYAGWISRDGKIHDPMFTFVSAMAINEGLVPKARGKKILTKMLKRLDEAGFNIRYGIPGPLYPLPENDRGTWAPMSDWGRYEHGGHCGQTAYHFLQALYNCDMKKEADEILFAMLDTFENEPTHNGLHPGYFKSWDWRAKDGRPCGYNYLADNYYFLLAAITGHYGVKL
jgi:hypothetical protein